MRSRTDLKAIHSIFDLVHRSFSLLDQLKHRRERTLGVGLLNDVLGHPRG